MSLIVAVLGPTASGKSAVALRLAHHLGGIVLSVDSMQVYRDMDIGTAKPTPEERTAVPHEMVDICDPGDDFSVAEFQGRARAVLEEEARPVVIAGGSGLHFRAVVDPLEFAPTDEALRADLETMDLATLVDELVQVDPDAGRFVDLANRRRVVRAVEVLRLTGETPTGRTKHPERAMVAEYRSLIPFRAIGLDPGAQAAPRVRRRLDDMRAQGFLDEVRDLRERMGRTASQAVGYAQLIRVVDGEIDIETGFEAARRATDALVKRQRTFFRPDPRIAWLDWTPDPDALFTQALTALELQ